VWFDKWEIQVGDSITQKIENGIRENEYLGIVLSPEALKSEWVKSELGAALSKQINNKKITVLPILYRKCDIPLLLSDRKYANFQNDYQTGLEELAASLGIKNAETISEDNWRKFVGNVSVNWKTYREAEYKKLVTALVNRAKQYNWSAWTGGSKNPYSITCSAFVSLNKKRSISIKLCGVKYMAAFDDEINPNNIARSSFVLDVGNSIEECEEVVWRIMEDFKNKYGNPVEKPHYHTQKFTGNVETRMSQIREFIQQFDWYNEETNKKE
jgi:hypothetical protein